MAISNYTLTRIFNLYKPSLLGAKISKIVRLSNYDFSFLLFSKTQESLIVSLEPINPYFLIASSYFKMIDEGSGFVASLRKYFDQGTIINLEKSPNDRIVTFTIKKMTPSYQIITNKLILELIPHNSNALILDMNDIIIDTIRKTTLDDKRPCFKGMRYTPLPSEDKSITLEDTLDTLKNKIGRNLYIDIEKRIASGEEIKDILLQILDSNKFYAYKNDVYSIPLVYSESKEIKLADLATLYSDQNQEKYMKKHYFDIFHLVEHKLKGLRNKLIKLDQDLKKNELRKDYVEIGNALFMASSSYQKGMKEIVVDGKTITLDERLSLSENAEKYFKLYQKSKVALEKLLEQKELTKEKVSYFEKIQNQLKFASVDDILDINAELMNDGYIKQDKKVKYIKNKKKKKENEKVYHPHFVNSKDGTKIGFGLSSLQNEYLTFSLANKEDYFLHIKDCHGPHVIIFSSSPSDETILLACEIALFYAEKSVGDVYITKRKEVKKIPSHLGLVNMNNAKTIYLSSLRESTISLLKNLQKK